MLYEGRDRSGVGELPRQSGLGQQRFGLFDNNCGSLAVGGPKLRQLSRGVGLRLTPLLFSKTQQFVS